MHNVGARPQETAATTPSLDDSLHAQSPSKATTHVASKMLQKPKQHFARPVGCRLDWASKLSSSNGAVGTVSYDRAPHGVHLPPRKLYSLSKLTAPSPQHTFSITESGTDINHWCIV
jgi:hypothetical protein